ncbi:MAG: protein kinase, partial [Planctomycetes bacterium]|nr:protein kinase [Planctomycetota bacterium]
MENRDTGADAMNATCCPNHDTLEAYLLGKVDDDSIDAHLDECSDCQGVLDEMDAAVNLPFAGLRKVATASPDWQQPAFQHLVADAKNLVTVPFHGKTLENQVFGNYLLLNLIGSGGFGQVYKAIHRQLKKTVVVKLLGPAHAQSPESRGRFLREMEAVGRLASPHIVAAHDAGEIDGQLFLVMEHVEGKDLSRLVKDHGPLPIDQALDCVLQAARGLQHAHEAGIIHRDVKPSNLLLDERGTVKVLDLGLARFLCQPEISASVAGTVAFMAPELFEPGRLADERSDIYSLGCTLYVLLTGRVPFETRGPQGKLECPSAVEALFRRMVAHDPHDRPASMNAVIAELQRLMKPARRRHPFGWRSVIAAGVVIAASALVALAFWPPPPDRKAGDTPKTPEEARAPAHVAKIVTMSPNGAGPKIEMASIPAGDFFMGGSDSDLNALPAEKPRQKVKINRPFFLGTTEVTQALYEEIVGVNPSAFSAKGSNKARVKDIDTAKHPVESVSWLDAV